jgi:predicted transcriptional regulator
MLGWRQADLAHAAGISAIAIKSLERGLTDPRLSTVAAIERALAAAGVVLIDADSGGGPGVRFKGTVADAR